jgi:hypothetical protein
LSRETTLRVSGNALIRSPVLFQTLQPFCYEYRMHPSLYKRKASAGLKARSTGVLIWGTPLIHQDSR